MPHKCVKCSTIYPDAAEEMITGCKCGSKAFFFMRQAEDHTIPLLEVESINQHSEGKYELDIHSLFGKDHLIYKEEEGKYTIDLEESFRRQARK
jgi:predicted  nucleic acid-binding Zn-ribbon protein